MSSSPGIGAQIFGKVVDVGVVQRGLDLVEEAEGRGLELEHGKKDGDGGQRAFSARKQRQHLQLLSRRLRDHFNVAAQYVLRVGQLWLLIILVVNT